MPRNRHLPGTYVLTSRISDLRLADVIEVKGVVEGLQAGRLERGVRLVDVGDVGVDSQFASEPVGAVGGNIDHPVVVEDRRDRGRQGAIVVVRGRALEMVGAEIEEALSALAAQIDRRDDVLEIEVVEVDALKPIIVQEEFVAHPCAVPAELPHVIEKKVAVAFDRASQPRVSRAIGKSRKYPRLLLIDSDRANVVRAVGEPLAPVDLSQQSLLREKGRSQGEVVVGRQIDEIGQAHAVAEVAPGNERRR